MPWFTPGHDSIDSDLFHRGYAIHGRERGDGEIAGQIIAREHGFHSLGRRRYERKSVAPAAVKEQGVERLQPVALDFERFGKLARETGLDAGRSLKNRIHIDAVFALSGGIADRKSRRPRRGQKQKSRQ